MSAHYDNTQAYCGQTGCGVVSCDCTVVVIVREPVTEGAKPQLSDVPPRVPDQPDDLDGLEAYLEEKRLYEYLHPKPIYDPAPRSPQTALQARSRRSPSLVRRDRHCDSFRGRPGTVRRQTSTRR